MDVVTLAVAKKQAVSSANTYTDEKIEGLESGFDYKGSVASVEDLPMSGNQKGDEYTIADGSGSYVWSGTSWDRAGAQGPKGDKGDPGEDGEQGIPGRDGAIQYTAGTGIEITDDNVINSTGSGKVQDVQINSESILDDDGVANIPVANTNTFGVIKTNVGNGIGIVGGGSVYINKATDAEIVAKTQQYKPIVPANLQLAVDTGVKDSANYTSFTCEMADGTTKTLKLYSELI